MTMINPPTPWEMDTGSFIRLYHDADQLTRDNIVIAMHLKLAEQRATIRRQRAVASGWRDATWGTVAAGTLLLLLILLMTL
jgi:hypothetical protein